MSISGYGPCMCGATDCPRCYPGCNRSVECSVCGAEYPAHIMTSCDRCHESVCEDCECDCASRETEEDEE